MAKARNTFSDKRPYTVFTALINQSGTNPPTFVNVLENTMNINPTWSYSGIGSYVLTSVGSFNVSKTTFEVGMTEQNLGKASFWDLGENFISIKTYNNLGVASNNILTRTLLEIRIYN